MRPSQHGSPLPAPHLGLALVVQLGGEGDEAGALVDGEQAVPIPPRDAEADGSIWGGQKMVFERKLRVETLEVDILIPYKIYPSFTASVILTLLALCSVNLKFSHLSPSLSICLDISGAPEPHIFLAVTCTIETLH